MSAAPRWRRWLCLGALALAASSCAYYNTFYLARRYYFRATEGAPYSVDRPQTVQTQQYTKSIDFSKKVLGIHPRSKWVDDAYLLWARALIGREDPLQTISMLTEFDTRFPESELRAEAGFYLGLAYRNARRYPQSVAALDSFLLRAPRHVLVPYAHLERSRALVSLERYADAAEAAGQVLEHFPRHELADRARRQRAEARFQQGDFAGAREDFRALGTRARTEDERFTFLLRQADCLEAARDHEALLQLLRSERAGVPPPVRLAPGQLPPQGGDRYGRLTLRMGAAMLLRGDRDAGLEQFAAVLQDYPKSNLAAEAQYRIGYAWETVGEDFDRARIEYQAVKDQSAGSPFVTQAQQRLANLERIAQYRAGAGADSLEKQAEAGFLTAELYVFQFDRPERAIEEYRRIALDHPGTSVAARALTAEAWVLSRRLKNQAGADSLLWRVVREFPATESQLAARDYLEAAGHVVDPSLIVPPAPKPVVPDTSAVPAPAGRRPEPELGGELRRPRAPGVIQRGWLGEPGAPVADSLGIVRPAPGRFRNPEDRPGVAGDSLPPPPDSTAGGRR